METFKFQFPVSALNQLIDQSNHKNSRNEFRRFFLPYEVDKGFNLREPVLCVDICR